MGITRVVIRCVVRLGSVVIRILIVAVVIIAMAVTVEICSTLRRERLLRVVVLLLIHPVAIGVLAGRVVRRVVQRGVHGVVLGVV